MSEDGSSNGALTHQMKEKEQSKLKSQEEAARLEAKRSQEHKELVQSGRAIDVRAAMARCFSSGNHGTEALRGDAPVR